MTNTKKGFTLIELLIVITIIGILAAALLPSILGAPARARDAARVADLNQVVTALETYASDNNGSYPAENSGCLPTELDAFFQGGSAPNEPNATADSGKCVGGYTYCRLTSPNNYLLAAAMETTGGQSANGLETEVDALTCDGTDAAPTLTAASADTYVILK